jgi:hypothetical protein
MYEPYISSRISKPSGFGSSSCLRSDDARVWSARTYEKVVDAESKVENSVAVKGEASDEGGGIPVLGLELEGRSLDCERIIIRLAGVDGPAAGAIVFLSVPDPDENECGGRCSFRALHIEVGEFFRPGWLQGDVGNRL